MEIQAYVQDFESDWTLHLPILQHGNITHGNFVREGLSLSFLLLIENNIIKIILKTQTYIIKIILIY